MNNHAVRRRRNKSDEKTFLFTARKDLWKDVEEITQSLDVSIAHYIRESLRRNNAAYKKSELV